MPNAVTSACSTATWSRMVSHGKRLPHGAPSG